jgi:4-amino-4-deoxy-L-arabinose transferase-like glycosyltransferase
VSAPAAGAAVARRVLAPIARVPAAAWLCALVAFLNATAWSIVTPAFQLPDEQSHYAYTEYLAEHGRPPDLELGDRYSTSQAIVMARLRFDELQFQADNGTIWTAAERARLERDMAQTPGRSEGNGDAQAVGGEPPLYYALEAIPYKIGAGGTVLDRLALMRLLSALLGGVTVLLTFLFLREALPGSRWLWTVGALGVAFQPLFGFITGGVNSDALLYAASAGLFYLLARAFRRGLTLPVALAVGATMAVGALTKFNYLGLLPAAAIGLLVVATRGDRGWSARSLRLPAIALAIPLAAIGLEMALNANAWDRPTIGASASAFSLGGIEPSLGQALSYVWQFYLVPLPGMTHYISDVPLKDQWIGGFVGLYGWVDTRFRPLVYDLALVPLAAIAVLAVRALVVERGAVSRRRAELLVYGLLGVSFVVFVATASYIVYARVGQSVAQMRYLFPLLPLYAGLLVLATRGAGRRWAPVVGTAIVLLAVTHTVFSLLLVVERYYA